MFRFALVALAGALLAVGPVHAVDVYLVAKELDKPLPAPDGPGAVSVRMWGYALDPDDTDDTGTGPADGVGDCFQGIAAACDAAAATVPGPRITVSSATEALRVFLSNRLPEPSSVVIPGQELPWVNTATPVWTDGSAGPRGGDLTKRVRSFTGEAAPGGTMTYVWNNVRQTPLQPGTYLYQSGTHPGLQVHMGLYGAVTRDTPKLAGETGKVAYRAADGSPIGYVDEVVLVYSEVDKALHDAAALDDLSGAVARPLDYDPDYYLVNGEPFDPSVPGSGQIYGLGRNRNVLLRLLNAGLEAHVAQFQQLYMRVIAEDGKVYPFAKEQYSVGLPPGKTADAVVNQPAAGTFALYDQQLALTTGPQAQGGLMSFLNFVTPGAIDFNQVELLSYVPGQDQLATVVAVEDGGDTLHLAGNTWKRIDLDYPVTADTILEFDFRSDVQGEVHAIGLDEDDALLSPAEQHVRSFQLWGTDAFVRAYQPDGTHAVYGGSGWQHYCVQVGQTYATDPNFPLTLPQAMDLTFVNDHDVAMPDADSWYRRVKVRDVAGGICAP